MMAPKKKQKHRTSSSSNYDRVKFLMRRLWITIRPYSPNPLSRSVGWYIIQTKDWYKESKEGVVLSFLRHHYMPLFIWYESCMRIWRWYMVSNFWLREYGCFLQSYNKHHAQYSMVWLRWAQPVHGWASGLYAHYSSFVLTRSWVADESEWPRIPTTSATFDLRAHTNSCYSFVASQLMPSNHRITSDKR